MQRMLLRDEKPEEIQKFLKKAKYNVYDFSSQTSTSNTTGYQTIPNLLIKLKPIKSPLIKVALLSN